MDTTIPVLFRRIVRQYPDYAAQYSKDSHGVFVKTDFRTLYAETAGFACGLLASGVKRGDHVGLISDNRKEWFIADLALLSVGAADVPRGCDSMATELGYILGFADCETVLVEDSRQLAKVVSVRERIPALRLLIVLDRSFTPSSEEKALDGIEVLTFDEVMKKGAAVLAGDPQRIEREIDQGSPRDLATIIFTSGTTGTPKGVMLCHDNFLHQVRHVPELVNVGPGDIWLCVLPVWHSFERVMQYVALGSASALAYSKPIGKIMLADIATIRPTWMASVPRIWESIRAGIYANVKSQGGVKEKLFTFFVGVGGLHAHLSNILFDRLPEFRRRSRVIRVLGAVIPWLALFPLRKLGSVLVFGKIRDKLGGRFVAGISGGGALPATVDGFFQAAGILLLEGYGLTETAPVLAVRSQHRPISGTVGPVFPGTEIRIVDEERRPLPPGTMGLILARGPQVMLGYYKREEDTRKIIDSEGWLNTGDLGMLTVNNELKITGRAKDTIVLMGGENVEPAPIEEKLRESSYIDHAVVLGQDQKFLAALIVPNSSALEAFTKEKGIPCLNPGQIVALPEVIELINSEIKERVNHRNGFRSFEQIFRFTLLPDPFEVGVELSAKQEIKRHAIGEKYRSAIDEFFR